MGRFFGDRHLRHLDHPARRCASRRDCRDRLWIHCHCRLRAGRAGLYSVFHRSEDGVAVLGLVPLFHPVRLLSGDRRGRGLCHRKSRHGSAAAAACGQSFNRRTHGLVPGPVHHLPGRDLRAPENTDPHKPHLQRHFRRLFRRNSGKGVRMTDDRSFHDAKRLYLEQYGDPMVTNTYLKIALVFVSLVAIGLALMDLKTVHTFENFRPLVIRIDDLGRAEAIDYHNLEYKPQDAEAKYFLSQFSALFYRRNRYTIQDDFSKSLYFLDGKLANGILDAYRKDEIIRKFLTNTSSSEIDIDVKKISLEELQTPPFRARVDFYMVYYSPADHSELKRDLYTANFLFLFKSHVPNELIPINPLGLTITYFR